MSGTDRRARAGLSETFCEHSSHDRHYGETNADEPNPEPFALLADFGRSEPDKSVLQKQLFI